MGDAEKPERGFTVVDRRSSAQGGGEEREERAAPAEAPSGAPPPQAAGSAGAELPAIDFSTFALSLGTSALYHLGLVDDPESGEQVEPNLPLAQQTIDTLAMLQEKTRGNLDASEARLIENLLYELRMRFVEAGE